MSRRLSVAKPMGAISMLWVCSLVGAGLSFLTQVALARVLHPNGYGAFTAALATASLLTPLAGFGIAGFWLKVFGAEGWRATRWLSPSIRLVFLSTLVAMLTLAGWAKFGAHDSAIQSLLYWMLPTLAGFMFVDIVGVKMQLEERYSALALLQLLPHLARFITVASSIFVFHRSLKPNDVAIYYALVAIIIALFGIFQIVAMIRGDFILAGHDATDQDKDSLFSNDSTTIIGVLYQAWPFGMAGIFHLIYFQSSLVLLKYLSSNEQAGLFAVAFAVMSAVYLLPTVIFQKFLIAKIHRWAIHDRQQFLRVFRIGNGLMLTVGTATTILMLLLVPYIIPKLFSASYLPATNLLQVLAFCAPVRFLATSVGATLVTNENIRRKILYMGATAVISLASNIPLIILFGSLGAAISTLIGEICLLTLYLLGARRHVFGSDAWRGWGIRIK